MVTDSFRRWRDFYKAAKSAGLDTFAAQQFADMVSTGAKPVTARRCAIYNGNARMADRYADDY